MYRRHYVTTADPLVQRLAAGRGDPAPAGDLSAVTELVFATREEAEDMVEQMLALGVLEQVLADEAAFIAPGGVSWLLQHRVKG
ncbi:hypothetical protein GIS00_09640 [Nakamurella sp. YIM 132087]|uniref:Uncharacterized protein n=1 Tax=Nakamurella alba TaxID=2665158 RepID=A0A7K1FJA4_9ACTN|nr:hypothetical protein [Nakamurella alba]MTD14207.1 hypothetical protein [Nakamurella alba]